jgi:hypothetical protein
MVGIGGETSSGSDRAGMPRLWLSEGRLPAWLRTSDFTSASFGFQSASKLTIGRPGLSLTALGVGSLGLRSFRRMLVACRISSLRISRPFLVGVSGRCASEVRAAGGGLEVYAGFLDCEGGFRWISDLERVLMGPAGVLWDPVMSCSNWTRFRGFRGLMRRGAGMACESIGRPRSILSCSGSSQICSPVNVPAISPLTFLLALLLLREELRDVG